MERDSYRIPNGIKVSNVSTGKLRQMGIDNGFIFVKVNGKAADDVYDLIQLLETIKGQVRVEGVTSNGTSQYLSFTFR
jgi:serine protease Do